MQQGARVPPALILSASRAARLGYETGDSDTVALPLEDAEKALQLIPSLIDPMSHAHSLLLPLRAATHAETLALRAVKLASLLPAAIGVPVQAIPEDILVLQEAKLAAYSEALALALEPVSRANVPLRDAPETEIIAFRPRYGGKEHLALVVAHPELQAAPLVRLHSSCVTGDMLESLRCDCGDQLRAALHAMTTAGGGVVLYLTQEGRGIGIANKLRAYTLQDAGLDTVEANEALGFDADERHFQPAAEMLRQLGFTRIRLMTNNPKKMEELRAYGIEVVERVPLSMLPGDHNARYLATKAERCGHLF